MRRSAAALVLMVALLFGGAALVMAQGALTGRFEIIGLVVFDRELGVERIARFDDPAPTVTAPPAPSPIHTPSPTATPSPSPTRAAAACQGETLVNLRVRADSSVMAETLVILPPGTAVTIAAFRVYEDTVNEWAFVEAGAAHGWAAAYYGGLRFIEWPEDVNREPAQGCLPPDMPIERPGQPTPPAIPPSWTLGPSVTPAPSLTPTMTPTSGPFVPPTQDGGTLPPATPGKPGLTCTLKATQHIRVRRAPGGEIVGSWTLSDNRSAAAFAKSGGYLWAQVGADRWAAVYDYAAADWWADSYEQERELCQDVTGWPGDLPLPAAVAALPAVGWTLVMGVPLGALIEAGEEIKAAGYTPAATLAGNSAYGDDLLNKGWLVNVRPWYEIGLGDHPDLSLSPESSAKARVQALDWFTRGMSFTTVQLTNETVWPSADYLNRWIIQAVKECDARGWQCIPVMFSTGTPELDWWPALRPAIRAMRARGHYLGYNAYPYGRDLMLCDQNQLYTTWRIRLVRLAVGEPLPRVWVSEAARGAGDMAPVVSDHVCFASRAFANGDYDVINNWFVGSAGAWQPAAWNEGQIVEFGRAFRARMSQ